MAEKLRQFQLAFGRYLRDPSSQQRPAGVPARRAQVYEELLFNNVSGFVNACFPVCKSLLTKDTWYALHRAFFRDWRCQTPYFHDIPGEFLQFLQSSDLLQTLPAWFFELAHYEWVELQLDTLDESDLAHAGASVKGALQVNPVLQNLVYQWPVHRIGSEFQPESPQQTFLVVYRTAGHKVKFTEVNVATSLLINILQTQPQPRDGVITQLEAMLGSSHGSLPQYVNDIIDRLIGQEILNEAGE